MEKDKVKSRSTKTTRARYIIYLDELSTNEAFRDNKFDATNPDIIKSTWKQLSEKLNGLGGPIKDSVGWKRTFTDWKSQVKAKARKNRVITKETENIGDPIKPLSDIEERLLDVTGWVVVNGISHVAEIGIDTPNNEENREEPENESPNQNKILRNQPVLNEHSVEQSPERPSKKRKTLSTCVQNILKEQKINYNDESENITILREIAKNVKETRVIEEKRLNLRKLELQVKYPDYDFVWIQILKLPILKVCIIWKTSRV